MLTAAHLCTGCVQWGKGVGGEALGKKREKKREEQLSSLRAVVPLSASHAFLLLCHGLFIVLDRAHHGSEYASAGESSRG